MSERASIGLDVGSTYVKALAVTADGRELHEVRCSTPWQSGADGTAELDATELVVVTARLLTELVGAVGDVEVTGVGVSGMAEAGVLLDPAGRVRHPIIAWFDPRGRQEIEATPKEFRVAFPEHTGLPVGPLATIAKLLYLRGQGVAIADSQWFNVPEFVAYALGGDRAGEISLASRTGLIDQGPGTPWLQALETLGATRALLPPMRGAGQPWGVIAAATSTGVELAPSIAGSAITVAGHDHLVASVAGGVLASHQLYDSLGTAEALVRPLDAPLEPAQRAHLAANGVNAVRHVLAGKSVMLAGARSGLLLRRVLQLIGVNDADGRDDLDRRIMRLPRSGHSGLSVTGADNADGILVVRADADGLSPELLFASTLQHSTEEVVRLIDLMSHAVPPADHTVVAGGWARMACVRRARAEALPGVTFSHRSEDTAFGAAMFGAYAASDHAQTFEAFARSYTPSPTHPTGQESHDAVIDAADQLA